MVLPSYSCEVSNNSTEETMEHLFFPMSISTQLLEPPASPTDTLKFSFLTSWMALSHNSTLQFL